jgi:hypothetical protein
MGYTHDTHQLARLEVLAERSDMRIAVDRVDGRWRAGFLHTNELGEAVFAVHATGRDESTAIDRLAQLVGCSGPRRAAGEAIAALHDEL